jgi:hypothetical protein
MASEPKAKPIARFAEALAKSVYVLIAAAVASCVAGGIGLRLAFDREWLGDFEDNGFALLLIILHYVFAGLPGLLVMHALLRKSVAPRWRDLATYIALASGIGLVWFVVSAGSPPPDASMIAYGTWSGAVAGLLFWLLTGRWLPASDGTKRAL